MAIRLDDFVAKLPEKQQEAIRKRNRGIDRRGGDPCASCARPASAPRSRMAEKLHIKQAAVSKLERRTDMYLSTLRSYIEAMGGETRNRRPLPQSGPFRITQFEALDPENRPQGWTRSLS